MMPSLSNQQSSSARSGDISSRDFIVGGRKQSNTLYIVFGVVLLVGLWLWMRRKKG